MNDHFGSTPFFTLFDSEKEEYTFIENNNSHHEHGTCHPMRQLAKYHIGCIICSGIGRRAIEALSTEGIKVYFSESKKVSEIIESVKAGTLKEIDPSKACHGHGQKAGTGAGIHMSESDSGFGHSGGGCQHHGGGRNSGKEGGNRNRNR
ncbi:MAG: NifB/NifX family molybdenum-iron cluster-binding protein [bacterium]